MMLDSVSAVANFVRDEEGQDIIEYALLAAFISIVVLVLLLAFRGPLQGVYLKILNALNQANTA